MPDSPDRIVRRAGDQIFVEGDAGSLAYIITRGKIEIFVTRNSGRVVLATRGPGEIIGEMAIIDDGPRSASALVISDCELVAITPDQLRHRISQMDPISSMCLSVAVARCREMAEIIESQGRPFRKSFAGQAHRGFSNALGKLSLEGELRQAIHGGELELSLQPIVRLPTRRLAGFEALVRWRHPTRGLLMPAAFIPEAEASGQIVAITRWCLSQVERYFPAIASAALANSEEVDCPFISVNVSGLDLEQTSFIDSIASMLRSSRIAPGNLKLEMTESVLMKSPENSLAALEECKRLGVSVAIGDFGTGYSSLSCLSVLPFDTIKVDRGFVNTMNQRARSRKIMDMILGLAETLTVAVIAEGVESRQEEKMLRAMGCEFAQGSLYGKLAPLAEALALTRNWRPQKGRHETNPSQRVVSDPTPK
jgi:diguanylate cyclase